ncbi:MAG: cyclic pyranopterin monophosphate synthase MoaC [Candidatus Rokuibacteriota bacterium]|nr:MAG: cyclic pyranopterin monophosphate synthase MoaC [Candidatus Rokubacteria bacterium]
MEQETLIERLTAENEEFRRLRSEHQAHDQELEALKRTGPTKSRAGASRGLSHLSPEGAARMVDVSDKRETVREAVARAVLKMAPATLRVIRRGNAPKGDVLGVARTAGILAAKRTPQLIPLCHPLRITGVDVTFSDDLRRGELAVEARVRTVDKTGVEMEALTAVSVAALTVYDMIKAVERGVTIAKVQLVEKSGGKSGPWRRRA